MSKVPDAWEDEWSNGVDNHHPTPPTTSTEAKKAPSKVTKAQRRAQQAEFNRQLWAEAEGPRETNYFLESRNVVPLRSEFKPPPVLLSRKGPIIQNPRKAATSTTPDLQNLSIKDPREESSEDEEDVKAREVTLAERQAQAAKDREEKQRKYEERRQELFGTSSTANAHMGNHKSGTSTPSSLTPPGSRSATPNRGRGGKGGRRGGGPSATNVATNMNTNNRTQPRTSQHRDLYDPSYSTRPDSRPQSSSNNRPAEVLVQPIRLPKGPDGSGRGGFGFANARPARDGIPATQSLSGFDTAI